MKAVYLSVQTTDAKVFEEIAAELRDEFGYDITIAGYNGEEVEEDPLLFDDLKRQSLDADFIFIKCMADPTRFKRFEKYENTLKSCKGCIFIYSGNLDVRLLYRDYFKGTDQDYILLCRYTDSRGKENERCLFLWAYRKYVDDSIRLPEPVSQRADGVYHPGMDIDISLEDYLKTLDDNRPTVGLLFTSNLWIYKNLEHIDRTIECLESYGMNVIPVFYSVSTSSQRI